LQQKMTMTDTKKKRDLRRRGVGWGGGGEEAVGVGGGGEEAVGVRGRPRERECDGERRGGRAAGGRAAGRVRAVCEGCVRAV
jgi:hypothetical protein